MNAFRAVALAAYSVAMLWALPAFATKDFDDIGFLFVKVSEALEYEPTGAIVRWSNPATGNGGRIIVTRTYFLADGAPCREYTRTTEHGSGPSDREAGTGCRDEDGRWSLTEGRAESGGPVSLAPVASPPTASRAIATEPLPPASPPPTAAVPPPVQPAGPAPAAKEVSAPVAPTEGAKESPQSAAKPKPVVATATIPRRSD